MCILLISLSLVTHIADLQKLNLFILILLNVDSHFSLLNVKLLFLKDYSLARVDLIGSSTSRQSKLVLVWKQSDLHNLYWGKYTDWWREEILVPSNKYCHDSNEKSVRWRCLYKSNWDSSMELLLRKRLSDVFSTARKDQKRLAKNTLNAKLKVEKKKCDILS